MGDKVKVHYQSAFDEWPLEPESVQAVITSPPYWQIRKYPIPDIHIKETGWTGQYGLEPTEDSYLTHTQLWIEKAIKTLKPDGVFFLNIGDTYRNGTLYDIPYQVSIMMRKSLGMYKRNTIIWHKPNNMPGSMKNRFISRHEYVYAFTKKETGYFFDIDKVRVPYREDSIRRMADSYIKSGVPSEASPNGKEHTAKNYEPHPLGANPGDVWVYSSAKRKDIKHFSIMPSGLAERLIKCSTRPSDTVLDPFCGSGTTLQVSEQLNRKSIGFDLGYKDAHNVKLSEIQKELLEK